MQTADATITDADIPDRAINAPPVVRTSKAAALTGDAVANLDVLRAFAVLAVFFSHLSFVFVRESDVAWHFGQLGVLTFFVHTSLVLLFSLERQASSGHSGRTLFQNFYIRRAFRIYPLAIVCVLLAWATNFNPDFAALGAINWSAYELAINLTLTQNIFYQGQIPNMVGGLWSLPLEVQMYVLLPFLFLLLRKRHWGWALGLWALSVPIALLQGQFISRLSVLGFVPCFAGGILAWRLTRSVAPKLPGILWPVGIALAALVWFTADHSDYQQQTIVRWIYCLCLGFTIPLFHSMSKSWFTEFSAQVAKYSYGIYLTHMALIKVILLQAEPTAAHWALFALASVVLPVIAFHWIEEPMVRLGRRVADGPATRIRKPDQSAVICVSG